MPCIIWQFIRDKLVHILLLIAEPEVSDFARTEEFIDAVVMKLRQAMG